MTRTPAAAALLSAGALLLAACSSSPRQPFSGGDDAGAASDALTVGDAPAPAGDYYVPAGYTLSPFLSAQPERSFAAAATVTDPARHYLAVLETDAGRLVLDLDSKNAPVTVNSFVFLARHHFFDGVAFHRVVAGFVAQGGDPNTVDGDRSTWGQGGPGYHYGLEVKGTLKYDGPGVVGMARTSDPDTNGSQFFITLAATHNLDGQYTIFAHVSEGQDVPAKMARGEPPATPTRMKRVYVVEKATGSGTPPPATGP